MYISFYMTLSPVTIGPDHPVVSALELLEQHDVRHLPVVDDEGRLLGMVTDRDLRSARPSSVLSSAEQELVLDRVKGALVHSIMSTDLVRLHPCSTLDDALLLFRRRRVGALPVVDSAGKVVGIFSLQDLMIAYSRLFGLGEKGSALVALEEPSDGGNLATLVATLEKRGIRFNRLVRTGHDASGGARIYLRVCSLNMALVQKAVEEAGFSLFTPAEVP